MKVGSRRPGASKKESAAPRTKTTTSAAAADTSAPSVGAARRLFWHAQNLVFENPVARRLAGHMLMLVAERPEQSIAARE